MNSKFKQNVLEIVKQIPVAKTLTYGQVAAMAGNPKAARAVGMIMSKNFNPAVPCHRVIRADGKLGNYNRGGFEKKKELLSQEFKAQIMNLSE